jgi:iron complex transport system substrate-binding protein
MSNAPVPQRIVSFSRSATEILTCLGFPGEVTTLKEYLEDSPPASDRDKPEYWFTMAINRAVALKADLILTSSVGQSDLHKRLKNEGFQTLHLDPGTLREVEDSFLQVGKAVDRYDEARRLSNDFTGGVQDLAGKVPPRAYRPKLYVEHWGHPPTAAGGWVAEILSSAGAHYFPMLSRETTRAVRIQELMKFDPEIILFAAYGQGLSFDPGEILKRIGWQDLSAVRKRRVFSMEESLLNVAGPRLLEGAKVVQWILGEGFWGWPLLQSTFARRIQD